MSMNGKVGATRSPSIALCLEVVLGDCSCSTALKAAWKSVPEGSATSPAITSDQCSVLRKLTPELSYLSPVPTFRQANSDSRPGTMQSQGRSQLSYTVASTTYHFSSPQLKLNITSVFTFPCVKYFQCQQKDLQKITVNGNTVFYYPIAIICQQVSYWIYRSFQYLSFNGSQNSVF